MKLAAVLSTAVVAHAAVIDTAAHLEKRQMMNLGTGMASFIANAKSKTTTRSPFSKQDLKPAVFPNAKRQKVIWGPFPLQPSTSKHTQTGLKLDAQSDVLEDIVTGLCTNCMVLKGAAEVTDKEGKRLDLASKIYTHHVIVANFGDKPITRSPVNGATNSCPDGQKPKGGDAAGGMMGGMMGGAGSGHSHGRRSPQAKPAVPANSKFSIFIGQGNEGDATIFAPINSTALKSGYWIGKDDKIAATAELINYDSKTQDVYITIDVEYLPMESRPAEYLETGISALQYLQCGTLALYPPKDRSVTYKSGDSIVSKDGWIISVMPHLHDGAINLKLFLNNEVVCNSKAIYGKSGASVNGVEWETIVSYEPCSKPIKLTKGDKMRLESEYDLTQHKLRPASVEGGEEAEGMAIAKFQYAVSI
ncbi:hypothetical protein BT63DRAFT_408254 [Microthyrium microscopicum]|uniref:Concanavalin A-like lectin/glucanase n=1 Tax=Microthyrium microscopicum TaxID=703497 RepID=A0A6A6UQH5_9PEZI|nr:hypothetical protein BT63DRAFT_408254 [Microthyrium microscopicum]